MSRNILEVAEGIQFQTSDERIARKIDVSKWDTARAGTHTPFVYAYDETNNDSDVTSAVFPTNSPTLGNGTITFSVLRDLTKDHSYRVEARFIVGSNHFECVHKVKCVR